MVVLQEPHVREPIPGLAQQVRQHLRNRQQRKNPEYIFPLEQIDTLTVADIYDEGPPIVREKPPREMAALYDYQQRLDRELNLNDWTLKLARRIWEKAAATKRIAR